MQTSVEEGAFELSSGLIYVLGYYASTDELIFLAKVAASCNGTLLEVIGEAIEIGQKAKIPVQICHCKNAWPFYMPKECVYTTGNC